MLYDHQPNSMLQQLTDNEYRQVTFAQFGEDVMMMPFLESRGLLWNGYYVDVGAHHPFKMSNTAIYHCCFGWRGINIDADPRGVEAFKLQRPSDTNLCALVSDRIATEVFYTFNHTAVNTADSEMVARQASSEVFKVEKSESIETTTLKLILDRYLPSDQRITLLSIDVEGFDLRCLVANDWYRYRPIFVLVEDHSFDLDAPNRSQTHQFLSDRRYKLVSRCAVSNLYYDCDYPSSSK